MLNLFDPELGPGEVSGGEVPTKFRPEVTEMKVMLFAYHPPGVYWFDNVKIEPVSE